MVASSVGMLLVAAICIGGTFMVLTMAGMQEARRVAGNAAPRLMAAMTAAFALGQLLGPVVVSVLSSSATAFRGKHCRCRAVDRRCGDSDRVVPSA